MAEAGHVFLAKLGKKRLRPGGKQATDWLLGKAGITKDSKILEVACNMGTTTVELAKTYGCHITAIDLDEKALRKARENIKENGVEDLVDLRQGNAMDLPFDDASFDIVINEAMLTMLPVSGKEKALHEYHHVLKSGGLLLTHDVCLKEDDETIKETLSKGIGVTVVPLTEEKWKGMAERAGFSSMETLTGDMSLMSIKGMIRDEGRDGTLEILKNAFQPENLERFISMFQMFARNKDKLGFIAMVSHKSDS